MNRCPISYEPCGNELYSQSGLHTLSRDLNELELFPYSVEEQVHEAAERAAKMSIQGVQPKLSARLRVKEKIFEITDKGGVYILKPQNPLYAALPENEDLTMRLANSAGMKVPLHGMIYSKDRSLTYFIRRFDRTPRGRKFAQEDFAQLSGLGRDSKYDSSMEKAAEIVERFCTFPELEKIKLFKLVVFNYLTGNEDAHLKNFSLVTRDRKVELSPCYDLVNSTIVLRKPEGEIALPLAGKKKKLTRKDFVEYYAGTRLKLRKQIIDGILNDLTAAYPDWRELVDISFLPPEMKASYLKLLSRRAELLLA